MSEDTLPGDEEIEDRGFDALMERVYPNVWEHIEFMKKTYELAKKSICKISTSDCFKKV